MAGIDVILDAAVDTVKKSGALEAGALMGTVSAVGTDGTLTVARGADTYPRVRMLSGYAGPAAGDLVEILNTTGGWVCPGKLITFDTSWQYPTPSAPFTAHASGFQLPRYRRSGDCVEIEGLVDTHNSTVQTPVFTLPVGWRPSLKYVFAATGSNAALAQMRVHDDGTVFYQTLPALGTAGYISLNCRFAIS